MPFDRWNTQIKDATETDAQRTLLSEIGLWRARNLADIPGLRDAAFAMSSLYRKLGDNDAAVREAQALLSLCQTAPPASREETQAVQKALVALGQKPARVATPPPAPRSPRAASGASAGPSGVELALQKAGDSDFEAALKLLQGKRGRAELIRAWVYIAQANAAEGAEQKRLLNDLDRRLRDYLGVNARPAAPVVRAPQPPTEADGALGALLGMRLPKRRDGVLKAMEEWLSAHPDQADHLAHTALQHHVDTLGTDALAPWFARFVAAALLEKGSRTEALLETHAGSPMASLYAETPFRRGLSLVANPRFAGLRRSVLGRNAEPDDRRAWTLRFDQGDRMLVLLPEHEAPYPAELAQEMADRLPHLCPRVVVWAPGAGNAPLREAIAKAGGVTLDGQPSDTELLAALDRVAPMATPDRPERAERAPKADKPARAERAPREEPVHEGPDPMLAVAALLAGDTAPASEALQPALQGLKKLRDAFLHAAESWSPSFPADASERTGSLLEAADRVAPEGLRVPEAVTLSLRVAAALGGPVEAILQSGSTAERFGGPGIAEVIGLVRGLEANGWTLRRAFRGTTRRERRNQPALAELSDSLDGLWRLGVEHGEARAEVWYVADLPVEGRAAVPQLLLEDRKRVVVLPADDELVSWYAGLDAPDAIRWDGDGAPVAKALDAL